MSGTILGIQLPKEEYGHTKSDFFYGKSVDLVNTMVGINITAFVSDDDFKSGATNSTDLIQELIEILGGALS